MSTSVIDMKKVLQAPGLYRPYEIEIVHKTLYDFLVNFERIEEAVGDVSKGLLEHHIKNLEETYKIVKERETED